MDSVWLATLDATEGELVMGFRMRRFLVMLVAGLGLTFGVATPASATLLFSSYAGEGTTADVNLTIGKEFTVGSTALLVNALGVYDGAGNGLLVSHDVGIWRVSGLLLVGSVTVPSGTSGTLVEDWRFANVSPFTLDANTTYRVAAHVGGTSDSNPIGGTFSFDSSLASVASSGFQAAGGSLAFPATSFGGGIQLFGNAQFTLVPEPSIPTLSAWGTLLLGSGLLALAAARRRAL